LAAPEIHGMTRGGRLEEEEDAEGEELAVAAVVLSDQIIRSTTAEERVLKAKGYPAAWAGSTGQTRDAILLVREGEASDRQGQTVPTVGREVVVMDMSCLLHRYCQNTSRAAARGA
jgi:hypothetical protein